MPNDRYQRHSLIDWFSQDEISSARACVIGAGAVGNEVIKNLVLLGVRDIQVHDFDQIELHNLTRSVLFREDDLGLQKSSVAAKRANDLDPNANVTSVLGNFWENLKLDVLQGFNVVFCCVDNFEARIRLNKICYLCSVDLVNVGIDSRFASVEVFPFSRSNETGCYECTLPDSVYSRMAQRYSCGWLKKISFVEKKVPTTIISSSLAAGMAVSWGCLSSYELEQSTA
jgi:molybdopterin-synthase adenylyltransferase